MKQSWVAYELDKCWHLIGQKTTIELPFSRNGSVDINRIFYDNVMKLLLYMLDVRFPCYMGIAVIGSLNACVWTVVSHGWCYKVNICQQVLFYIPTNTTNHLHNFTNDCIITIKEKRREKRYSFYINNVLSKSSRLVSTF